MGIMTKYEGSLKLPKKLRKKFNLSEKLPVKAPQGAFWG
jgi:hypothetical protein